MFMIHKNIFLLALIAPAICNATDPNTYITFITSLNFNSPYDIAITANGLYGYLTDLGTGSVHVIDTNSSSATFNQVIAAPALVGAFSSPIAVATTPNSLYAYVVDNVANNVYVIDTNQASSTFNQLISAPGLIGFFNTPGSIAITPNGHYAYVTNSGNNSVNVIDIATNTVLTTPGLNGILNSPFDIAINPNGLYAYVANLTGTVTVINLTNNTFVTNISANPQPEGLTITANGKFAYVTDGSNGDVTVIDTDPTSSTFNQVISTPNLLTAFNAPNDAAATPDSRYVYVTNFLGDNLPITAVSVIDTDPTSPTYNSTILTPGLSLPGTVRFFTIAVTPNARYAYAVDGFNTQVDVIYTGIIDAPGNFSGCKTQNRFLLQMELINRLTWSIPTLGNPPVAYKLYRNASLTDLIATLPATDVVYNDRNRSAGVNDTYYIISVDQAGTSSPAASTTVTTAC